MKKQKDVAKYLRLICATLQSINQANLDMVIYIQYIQKKKKSKTKENI